MGLGVLGLDFFCLFAWYFFSSFYLLLFFCFLTSSHCCHEDVMHQPFIKLSMLCLESEGQEGVNLPVIYSILWDTSKKETDLIGGQG